MSPFLATQKSNLDLGPFERHGGQYLDLISLLVMWRLICRFKFHSNDMAVSL